MIQLLILGIIRLTYQCLLDVSINGVPELVIFEVVSELTKLNFILKVRSVIYVHFAINYSYAVKQSWPPFPCRGN